MHALIIQHELSTPPGSTTKWLDSKGITYDIHFFKDGEVKNKNYDLLIICGGSQNVDQEIEFPWLSAEKKFIKEAVEKNHRILGLCLGSQLLAECLGAKVFRADQTEVGWQKVKLLESNSELMAFHWHSYQFQIPTGSVKTSGNSCTPNQGFKYNKNILAFQFHPESTEEWVIQCANDEDLPAPSETIQTKAEILSGISYQKAMEEWYFKQLDLFFL